MNVRRKVLAVCVLTVLALGGLLAQTITTRNFPINGRYWISIPASPNPAVTNAEQLLAYGPFDSVARWRTATNTFHTWNGTTCTPGIDPDSQGANAPCTTSCFCAIPGEAFQVTVSGAPRNWDINGYDGVTSYKLEGPPNSMNGTHRISLAIALPSGFAMASDLRNDINTKAGLPIVSHVGRYLTQSDTIQVYTGTMGTGPNFPLVPGEGYQVGLNGSPPPLAYTPPQPGVWDNPCIEPNAGGTIRVPPAICGYVSPALVHLLLEGLPEDTQAYLKASHRGFFNIVPLEGLQGTTTETFDSELVMQITGTGTAANVNCSLTMSPLHAVVETQPAQPGQPVQDFDADMKSLTGLLTSDTTCNLFQRLEVLAGTNNGLPSPGHVHLEQRPDGTFNVSSFFDVNVTMSFEGKPGSILEGMSGSTTQVVRMGTVSNMVGITLSPVSGTNPVFTDHTVTATLADLVGHRRPEIGTTFSVISGPNIGATGTCSANASCATDASGQVSFTYTSNGQLGTDQIRACFLSQQGQQECSQPVTKNWVCGANGTPCNDADPCTADDACSNGSCLGASLAPEEVGPSVRLSHGSGTSTIVWLPAPAATVHDVLRGLVSDLPVGPGGGDEVCLADNVDVTTLDDGSDPLAGASYWYLVRGENNCGTGPYGFQGLHGLPGAPRNSTTCP